MNLTAARERRLMRRGDAVARMLGLNPNPVLEGLDEIPELRAVARMDGFDDLPGGARKRKREKGEKQ